MRRIWIGLIVLLVALPLQAQDNTGYEEAERRIADAKATGATELDLLNLQLTELPESISTLTGLQTLNLAGNRLTSLPENIGNFTNLQELYASYNQLTSLPDSIGNLTELKILSAPYNRLTALPDSIGNLKNLKVVYLFDNNLHELPRSMGNLTQVNRMEIFNNPLTFPPPDVVSEGSAAVLLYLREYEQMQVRQVLMMGATGVSVVAGFGLMWRWKTRRGKSKKKRR